MDSLCSSIATPSKKMGKFVYPNGFPEDRQKALNAAVSYAIRLVSNSTARGHSTAHGSKQKADAIRARQAEVDEFLRQKTVEEVNRHTTEEADRVVRTVEDEGKQSRGAFQQLLLGNLPAAGHDGADPRAELRALRAAKALIRQREVALQEQVGEATEDSDRAAEAPPAAKRARAAAAQKYEALKKDGQYCCEKCSFKTDTHKGMATHMSRSHSGAQDSSEATASTFRGTIFLKGVLASPGFKKDVAAFLGESSIFLYIRHYKKPVDEEELRKALLEELAPAVISVVQSKKDAKYSLDEIKRFFSYAWAKVLGSSPMDTDPVLLAQSLVTAIQYLEIKREE